MAHTLPHTIGNMKMVGEKIAENSKVYNCILQFIHWWSKRWKK
jgi:hypothetical protein